MYRHEVEALALAVIERVERAQPAEDDALVELKREWPTNHQAAARRIAAHANSARGATMLWLIGVDEKGRSTPGAVSLDAASWFDQVRSHFEDRWAPTLQVVNVPRGAVTVVALLFDTEGAPFVVKDGERLEVPWRSGTQTRSAGRAELLKLLVPRTHAPQLELLSGTLKHRELSDEPFEDLFFELELDVYLTPQDERVTVLPYHRMKAAIFAKDGTEIFEFRRCCARTDVELPSLDVRPRRPVHLEATQSELVVGGPGRVTLRAEGAGQIVNVDAIRKSCEVRFQVRTTIGDVPVTIRQRFTRLAKEDEEPELIWRASWPVVSLIPEPSGL